MTENLTVAEVAQVLKVNRDVVRRMFINGPGVINARPERATNVRTVSCRFLAMS
jgi:hypothetical protein